MIRKVPPFPRVGEIEQAIKLLNRAAVRMRPYGRLRFELHWEPAEGPGEVVRRGGQAKAKRRADSRNA